MERLPRSKGVDLRDFYNRYVTVSTSLEILSERMFPGLFLYLSRLLNPISGLKNIGKVAPCEANLTWCGEIYQNKSGTAVIKSEELTVLM